ncbi:hypothetical protein BUALT_Bualt19G0072200 [Buddleja alternifolia]|uniref:BHLH domain-containing protein n=1 Tax=Buddleja alternifolia TaxID=168488 RepID=A0AAV6W7S6_9LAMI|nr:hypothetical protein BUALT_Bualt19G0072200 [Buddleja alternifolia]
MAEEPSTISNPETNTNPPRKKRRKIGSESSIQSQSNQNLTRWRTESEKQIYSSNLIDALCHLRRPNSAAATGRAVRDAADRVLAASAKGKTRWSRAMMTRRLSLRLAQINKKHKRAVKPVAGYKNRPVQKKPPVLQRKMRVLSRLVPGCRKISLPSLLEETTDYIAALEMQVKAMTFLTQLLNGGGGALTDRDQYMNSS